MPFSIADFTEITNTFVRSRRAQFPVLLVDDDLVFRELASVYLEDAGYEVLAVDSVAAAHSVLAKRNFPIIMVDWMMPGVDGITFCQQLRKENQPYRYIMMLSSKNDGDEVVQGLTAGADDYIIKGGRKSELIARLDCGVRVLAQQVLLEQQKIEILRKSQSDHLTATYNRGYLMEHLPREIVRSSRYEKSFSIILCDIDFFKKINDEYGHLGGDHALVTFANVLEFSLRKDIDWVARYGGEEFVVVLPNTDHLQAMVVAEKLRANVEAASTTWEGKTIAMTASFGVASSTPQYPVTSADALLALADKRLYKSKRAGRNCCFGEPLV
ncbi:MAG: diguanylate cyclase [Hahellaceae bacterium]|nr:diguanylate cyclase [Hahellaceae bacterium]MCP5210245.1 diguanylate cyclase [Hahellaceae bacterium]